MQSWLLGGPSYGVDEYVDQVAAGLRAHAVEHCLEASGSVRVGVADDRFGGGGEGQLDASTVVRVRRAAHQSGVGQPIDHR